MLIITSVVSTITGFFFVYKTDITPFYIVGLLITVLTVALRLLNISAVLYNAPLKTVAFANLSLAVPIIFSAVNAAMKLYFYYNYKLKDFFTDDHSFTDYHSSAFLITLIHIVFFVWLLLLSSEKVKNRLAIGIISAIISILYGFFSLGESSFTVYSVMAVGIFSLIRCVFITEYFIGRIRYGNSEKKANQSDTVQNNFGGMTI